MVMYLNENEKDLISKKIEEIESKSSTELIAVITKKSDNYKFETIFISLIFTLFISLISLFFEISAIKLFQIEVLSFLILYSLFNRFNKTLLSFFPKKYKYQKAEEYAILQFTNLGLNSTKSKQAIMFFVSIDEKYVKILTDSAINFKIKDSYWQNIVDEFIKDVKKDDFSNGYIKAINACSEILIKEFPIKENDKNELPNIVIEL